MKQLLNEFSEGSASEISSKITSAQFFDPSIEVEDDLTLIVARHTGEGARPSLAFEI